MNDKTVGDSHAVFAFHLLPQATEQERYDLGAGAGGIGAEGDGSRAGGDALTYCPDHGIGVVSIAGHISERIFAGLFRPLDIDRHVLGQCHGGGLRMGSSQLHICHGHIVDILDTGVLQCAVQREAADLHRTAPQVLVNCQRAVGGQSAVKRLTAVHIADDGLVAHAVPGAVDHHIGAGGSADIHGIIGVDCHIFRDGPGAVFK